MPGAPTLLRNVINYGLAADIPAALIEGRLFYATDEAMWYRDNGTTWDPLVVGVSSVDGETGAVDLSGSYEAAGSVSGHEAASDPHPDYLKAAEADLLYDALGAADAAAAAEVGAHAAVTTGVHGITDSADLVYTSDSRLTDARTPTAHATSHEDGGSDELELAPSQITGTAVVDSDARLADARTPTAHATSHAAAGSDPVTPAAIGADKSGTGIAMAIVFGG